jgi:hypothetical protein
MRWVVLLAGIAVAAGCSVANPWPGAPPPQPHHTLLVVGDSLAGQADVTLPGVLDRAGLPTTVIDAHVNGSGLIGPVGDAPSALEWVRRQMAAHPFVDTVLIQWAGACAVCGRPNQPVYGSAEFFAKWRANAHQIIDWLHTQDVAVVWVQSPPVGTDSATAASGSQIAVSTCLTLSQMDAQELAPAASRGVVDWFTAETDTALRYQTSLFYDGAMHQIRTDDLVHFTLDGSTRASTWTAKGLGDLWATLPRREVSIQSAPGLVEAGDPVTLDVGPGL